MSGTSLDEQGLGWPREAQEADGSAASQVRRLAVLTFAADKDHLALARMTAMHVAGLAGLPIGRVTDIRLAVDEACSLFLSDPAIGAGAMLTVRFDRLPQHLRIAVSGPEPARTPDAEDLGWLMLCALVDGLSWQVRDGIGVLTLNEPLTLAAGSGR